MSAKITSSGLIYKNQPLTVKITNTKNLSDIGDHFTIRIKSPTWSAVEIATVSDDDLSISADFDGGILKAGVVEIQGFCYVTEKDENPIPFEKVIVNINDY